MAAFAPLSFFNFLATSSPALPSFTEDSSWLRRILRQLVQQRPRHLYSHAFGTHPLSCWGPCFLSWNFGQLVPRPNLKSNVIRCPFSVYFVNRPFFLKRLVWYEVSVNSSARMIMLSDVRFPFILSTVPFFKEIGLVRGFCELSCKRMRPFWSAAVYLSRQKLTIRVHHLFERDLH
jgi:hypothetical protein